MSEPARRYAFVIEAEGAPDALVRVLTLFAVQPLALVSVTMVARQVGSSIRIEADGLDGRRAETLLRRLDGLAVVRSVGLGWRDPLQVAA
jgi:acetolactate synthase regulatory subunit